jgi:hypothetical protein
MLILSVSCSSELFLALLYHFTWLCHLSCCLLAFAVFFLLSVLHGVLDSNFKLCVVVVNGLIKGRLRKQVVRSLV